MKRILFLNLLAVFLGSFLIFSLSTSAASFTDVNKNIESAGQASGYETGADYTVIIGQYIKTALSVVGGLFVFLMAYGGFLWMTAESTGKSQIDKAKKVFTTSIIGLIVIVAAYAITSFVVSTVESASQQEPAPVTRLLK